MAVWLLVSVFVTGSAVLIIEILATRILSPYYGNTIYTTSSVIGTVLATLSLGYYLGGIFSDKHPAHYIFYVIIFASGILILGMQLLNTIVLLFLGAAFPITIGPLISSLFIFFIPAFLLGMLSPFAVKLHKKEDNKVGSQSGEVFFWSTVGSIAGSLTSGFILIPHFGISAIIIGTGLVLLLWGFVGVLCVKPERKIIACMALLFIAAVAMAWIALPKKASNVVYEKDRVYEKIKVVDGQWNGQPTRFLFQDRSYSAAMYLHSDDLVYDYTKYYQLYKLFNPAATRAFVIGGGAYSIPKVLLKDAPQMQVDVTEIEPELFNLAHTYFKLEHSNRLHNYTEDGRIFLSKNNKKYDVIISDVYYSLFSIPIHFTTKEFFNLAKSRLETNGVFIGNFGGDLSAKPPSFIFSEIKTFRAIFPNSYFFAVQSPNSQAAQNVIFLGINSIQPLDFKSDAVTKNNNLILRNLSQKNINVDNFDFSHYKELTDNFSPVEYLVSKVINRWQHNH